MSRSVQSRPVVRALQITAGDVVLAGDLTIPHAARGIVIFAHGSGSSRKSSRNQYVAAVLVDAGFATLLMDLLTVEEEAVDRHTGHLRFDIQLLAGRVTYATDYVLEDADCAGRPIGYFGASTGAGAALVAAAQRPDRVRAIVSRGGRPDLALDALPKVMAPTLLIVGARDDQVIALNQQAMRALRTETRLELVPGATHLFEEPGTLEQAARQALQWFEMHLKEDP